MLLSIVSGTYNRKAILQRMMSSVRRQMYRGMDYEFVIVDGGSTDGTIPWLKEQSDVALIEHGALRGAIPAFCDGARAATGQYVIMANDDISFHDNSLLAAIAHLEDTPTCGAVAFADNRYDRNHHQVMSHPTRDRNGTLQGSPYAQVGMFRRWLGEAAGWWGDHDIVLCKSRTYGGDNFLSARIWEMGYTVDPVAECRIDDGIERDGMRVINNESGRADSERYYRRYPDGPLWDSVSVTPLPHDERLRILYLPIYEDNHNEQRRQKQGLRNALNKVGIVLEYDFVTRFNAHYNTHDELVHINRTFRPHVLFTQAHRADTFQARTVAQMRTDNPEMVAVNWHGDYWPEVYLDPDVIALLKWFDLALVVNANIIPEYEANAIATAYWQVGSEEPTEYPDMPRHDVLFLANAYGEERQRFGAMLKTLEHQIGINVGIYGSGWGAIGSGQTLYDFSRSHALMRNAKICIGDNQHNDGSAFVSNRFYETLHAGGFLLHEHILNFQRETGYRVGLHYARYDNDADLVEKIRYYLDNPDDREKIRKAGQRYTKSNHSFDARVKELFLELIPERVGRRERVAV